MAKDKHKSEGKAENKPVTIPAEIVTAHAASMKSYAERDRAKKSGRHFQPEYDLNVIESYKQSLPAARTEMQKEHLLSVLSAGAGKYDNAR